MSQLPRLLKERGASTAAKCSEAHNCAEDQSVKVLLAGEVPLKFPQTPMMCDSGNNMRNIDDRGALSSDPTQPQGAKEIMVVASSETASESADELAALSFHEGRNRGNQAQVELPQAVERKIQRRLTARCGNLSR